MCSFGSILGGSCGPDRRDRKKLSEIVPLRSCQKDIARHKWTWSITGVENEVELILARAKFFEVPENIENLTICPSHRASLGVDWRRGSDRCTVPQEISGHRLQKGIKWPRVERGLDKHDSQMILQKTGIFLPVGSGKNKLLKYSLNIYF